MLITNNLDPGEMLAELLKGARVGPEATVEFANLRHDRDLCPKFADRLKTMLSVYKAYGHEVHDIQSFRDDGVDVLLRYEDCHGRERRAGLQVKSEDEFRRWEKGEYSLVATLKGQQATALSNVRVDEYYVVLCVDAVRHRKRIRTLCSELKNFRPCEIIEPEDVLDLYRASGLDLWARTARLLCRHDRVLEATTAEVERLAPDLAFLTVTLACQALGDDYAVDEALLFDIWSEWENFAGGAAGSQDRLSDLLWHLTEEDILAGNVDGPYTIRVSRLPGALCAIYFDLVVRMPDPGSDPRDHILSLARLRDRL